MERHYPKITLPSNIDVLALAIFLTEDFSLYLATALVSSSSFNAKLLELF